MYTSRQQEIIKILNTKIETENHNLKFARKQIDILDNARDPYVQALYTIDAKLFSEIEPVNLTLTDVQTKYQNRINSGCRTDLIWARSGIGTTVGISTGDPNIQYERYVCTKINPTVGLGTTAVFFLTSTGIAYSSIPGLQSDNLYGLKIYDEPYSQDILNSYVGSFIGTVGTASTVLAVMNPLNSGGLSGLKVGQIVVCDKQYVFSGESNEIIGIGTSIVNLSVIDSGISTTRSVVSTLILKNPTILGATAPESNGSFVTFTVLIDPDEIINVGIPFGSSPYVPQTIKMMTTESVGTGVSIFLDNFGISSASRSWNQFLNGFQDPDDLRSGKIVTEPSVGAGKIYYTLGFADKPLKNGSPAVVGDIAYNYPNDEYSDQATLSALPSCSSTINTDITTTESIRDSKKAEFTSGISTFNTKISIANEIRSDLNEINIRIWAYRGQIDKASSNVNTYNERVAIFGQDYISKLING